MPSFAGKALKMKEIRSMATPLPKPAAKRPYEKPVVRTETMFETAALACGKYPSGPIGQYQCGSILQNS